MKDLLVQLEEEGESSGVETGKAHADFANAAREFEESLRRAYFAGAKLQRMHQQWAQIPGQGEELEREVKAMTTSIRKYIKPAHKIYRLIKDQDD